ncbi:phage holin family protein [Enterococcus casseliflavus]|uniref:phage holin family protein n=1 Tax=Enterococcus casseliflavus TaxID=37734 RepID=UPI001BD157DE|nr:phage holin family protein [Enterococcus casseliflavus]MDV7751166.1 phage holin family protein [Enterococcus casseliflavus]
MDSKMTDILNHNWLQPIFAFVGVIVYYLFGSWIELMTVLIVLNTLDVLTGLMSGTKKRKLSSKRFYNGIKRKSGMWILIIVANLIDTITFSSMPVAKTAMCSYLIGIEGLSNLENLGKMGVPMPTWINKTLEQLKSDNDDQLKK